MISLVFINKSSLTGFPSRYTAASSKWECSVYCFLDRTCNHAARDASGGNLAMD